MGFFDPFGGNTGGGGSGGGSVSIDTTLTQSGKAADAKVTGDKIKKIETNGVATINDIKVVGELDSVDDLNIAGKVFEVEDKDSTGEIFNDYGHNIANGDYAHAEGFTTNANGLGSHSEGYKCNARAQGSHAEGDTTDATAPGGHSEGLGSKSYGPGAHAEGICTEATNPGAHSEGSNRTQSIDDGYTNAPQSHGPGAHAEGHGRRYATAHGAHVEGGDGYQYYINNGKTTEEADELVKSSRGAHTIYGHAEGMDTQVVGKGASHAEGMRTEAVGLAAHAEGFSDITLAHFIEPHSTKEEIEALWKSQGAGTKFSCAFGDESHVEGGCNLATGVGAHAEGGWTLASGKKSHAEGSGTRAIGDESHSEGAGCEASGNHSHAEGGGAIASGTESHAEGSGTKATGYSAHAEGAGCEASGSGSHAEGQGTRATNGGTHAEGGGTLASGFQAHAEGSGTTSRGMSTHAEGGGTTAYGDYSHAEGESYGFPSTLNLTSSTTNDEIINVWNSSKFSLAKGKASHVEGNNSLALGFYSHAEGSGTLTSGYCSHAEGNITVASGDYSHAEGQLTTTGGYYSHAEGQKTLASGSSSHAEGQSSYIPLAVIKITSTTSDDEIINAWNSKKFSLAKGIASHVEGTDNLALEDNGHAEGSCTTASGGSSHAEGSYTTASGSYSHAEGGGWGWQYLNSGSPKATGHCSHAEGGGAVIASNNCSHAEGYSTESTGNASHAEGAGSIATGMGAHAEGMYYADSSTSPTIIIRTTADSEGAHAEGMGCRAKSGRGTHAEGYRTIAEYGDGNHVEGVSTQIRYGTGGHAEGYQTTVLGKDGAACKGNHAEGVSTNKAEDVISPSDFHPDLTYDEMHTFWNVNKFSLAFGEAAHCEGKDCVAFGDYSHAEGYQTQAIGDKTHAEGENTIASGWCSHAEGASTKATNTSAHAEGGGTTASGAYSHAEGLNTKTTKYGTHAEGDSTIASSDCQHVQGKYNIEDSNNKYAFIIGNGTNATKRSNAIAIDWDGKIYVNNSSTGIDLRTVVSDIANRYTKTETDNAIKTKIAEVIANAPEDFDTLKEIADWIDTHSDSASAMNTAIKANTEAIQNLKTTSKAKLEYITLSYSDWNINEITVYSESIAEDSIITLNPGPSITEEQYSALSAARIIASEQGEGYIKLRALGEVTQDVNIPISILIQGNIIEAETNTITDSVTGEKYRFKISNGVMELEKI